MRDKVENIVYYLYLIAIPSFFFGLWYFFDTLVAFAWLGGAIITNNAKNLEMLNDDLRGKNDE